MPAVRKVYEKEPYFTPFNRAAACNQPEIIKYLASHTNINVDTRYMNGETPLHIACHRGHTDAVWAFLMAGADPYIRDKDNNTPLMSGHYWEPIAKLFLIYGIALSQEDIAQLVRRSLGDSDRWRTGSPQLVITLWRTSIAEPLNDMG